MPAEERRIITILFSDIVGSTPIAEQLDPEEWREIVESVHRLAGEIVLAHSGKVLQYLGDGILAIFGADQPSERDPERAIRAALDLVHQVPDLPVQPQVEMRAGVHTGLVVLGDLGGKAKREFTASGDAMNLAQRLQSLAEPSGVVISHESYRYVRGLFDILNQKSIQVKGRQAEVQPYLVRGYKDRPFRMVARGVGGIKTTTVGRSAEMARLNQHLHDAIDHNALIWSQIIAGPGLGKTRMLGDVIETLDLIPGQICLLRTQALEGDTLRPFAAIRRMWFDRFALTEDVPTQEVEASWQEHLGELLGSDHTRETIALGMMLGLAFKDHPASAILRSQPGSIKPLAYKASQRVLDRLKAQKPLILLIEDLQWADSASWDYFTHVFLGDETMQTQGSLILATTRLEWSPPPELLADESYQQTVLNPLHLAETEALLGQLLQRCEAVPADLFDRIVQRSEGVPYFVEEMVNWLIDGKAIDLRADPWLFRPEKLRDELLPPTLHHLLSTRLNNLSDRKRNILQAGAIFGRAFWQGGLVALGIDELDGELESLEQRGFIQSNLSSSFLGDEEWVFHHSLMQEVAYESVLKRDRPGHHLNAAEWLEDCARETGRLREFSGQLGNHYEQAGEHLRALGWYLKHDELLSDLGQVDQRGIQLDHMTTLARETQEPQMLARVYYHHGSYLHSLGKYAPSLESLKRALAALDGSGKPDLEGLILAYIVTDQSRLGNFELARESADRALELVQQIKDERTIARMLTNISMYFAEGGDIGRAAELYEHQIEMNRRTGEVYGEAIGYMNVGYLLLQLGMFSEGIQALEQAAQLFQKLQARRMQAYCSLNLGLAYLRAGEPEQGRKMIDEQACEEFEATQDRFAIGVAGCYLGLCHEAKGDFIPAREAFHDAHKTLSEIGVPGQAMDALAGYSRSLLELGQAEAAVKANNEVWAFLRKEGAEGLEFPLLAYQTCARVFEAVENMKGAKRAMKEGQEELMKRAERISDEHWRRSFLENIPEHHKLKLSFDTFINGGT